MINITALIVIAVVILIFILLLNTEVRVYITYLDNELCAYCRLFYIFKIPLYPSSEPDRYMTVRDLKKTKKRVKKKKPVNKNKKTTKKGKNFSDVRDMFSEVLDLIGIVFKRFIGKIKFRFNTLDITVATPDAALTALSYAFVCNTLDLLLDMLSDKAKVNCQFISPSVRCDYLAEKFSASIDILISVRIWQALCGAVQTITDKLKRNI